MKKYILFLKISVFLFVMMSFLFPKNILFLGDSISSGYGVKNSDSFPNLLEKKLNQTSETVKIINASISGSTSSTGYERLEFQLKMNKIDILFLELGANDGLREYSTDELKLNLLRIIELAEKNDIKIILVGIDLPKNYSVKYRNSFQKSFDDLSKRVFYYIPSLLGSLYSNSSKYFQDDFLHPSREGHEKIANELFPIFIKILK